MIQMNGINKMDLSLDDIIKLNQASRKAGHKVARPTSSIQQNRYEFNVEHMEEVQEDIKPDVQSLLDVELIQTPTSLLSIQTKPTPKVQHMAQKIFNEIPSSGQRCGLITRNVNGRPHSVFTNHANSLRTQNPLASFPRNDSVLHRVNQPASSRLGRRRRRRYNPPVRQLMARRVSQTSTTVLDGQRAFAVSSGGFDRMNLLNAVNRRQDVLRMQQQQLIAEQQLLEEEKQQLLNIENSQIRWQLGTGSLTVNVDRSMNHDIGIYVPMKKRGNRNLQLWTSKYSSGGVSANVTSSSISFKQSTHLPRSPPAAARTIVDIMLGGEREDTYITPATTSLSLSERFMRKVNLSGP